MVKLLQQLLLANLGENFLLTAELFQKIWAIFHSNNWWHYIPPSTSVLRAKTRLTETPPALFTGFPLPNGLDGMAFVNSERFAPDLVIREGSSVTSDFILFLTVRVFSDSESVPDSANVEWGRFEVDWSELVVVDKTWDLDLVGTNEPKHFFAAKPEALTKLAL